MILPKWGQFMILYFIHVHLKPSKQKEKRVFSNEIPSMNWVQIHPAPILDQALYKNIHRENSAWEFKFPVWFNTLLPNYITTKRELK